MLKYLPIVVVALAVLSSGAVSGVFTGRWAPTADLKAIAQRAQLPSEVGDWIGREMVVTAPELKAAKAAGIVCRVYTDRRNGTTVGVTLVYGKGGPVSVHTPEVCYPNSGFEEVGPPKKTALNGENTGQFCVCRFRKPGVGQGFVSVVYGWHADGNWATPDNPRLIYARRSVLFKLYAVSDLPNEEIPDKENPSLDLLSVLLPQLNLSLTSVAGSSESSR